MSFNVQFYSFAKEVNSSELPSGNGTVIPCVANDGVDIINPVISLQRGNGGANSPTAWNYCKIPSFNNRFYFIENWEWRSGLWHAHCAVDVLATYRTQIRNMSAYVVRSAHSYDGTISDALYLGREEYNQEHLFFSTPWVKNIEQGTVVVGVAGNGTTSYYLFTYENFTNFLSALLSDSYVTQVVGAWGLQVYSEAKSIVDPLQYITSVVYIPFTDHENMRLQDVSVGFGSVNVTCRPLTAGVNSVTSVNTIINNIPKHPLSQERGEYLNYSPWSYYSLDASPFGNIEIDPSCFYDAINLVYHIDWITGNVILRVWGDKIINGDLQDIFLMNVLKGQLGVTLEIGQVINKEMGTLTQVQHGANLVSQIMGGITGGGGTGGMIANQTGAGGGVSGVVGAIGSVVGGVASAVSGISGWIRDSIESKIPHLNSTGSLGSFVELYSSIWLNFKCIYPMYENREQRGRPLCRTMRLGDLAADVPDAGNSNIFHSGYLLIADPDVRTIAATASERMMIVSFMTGGFYLA